MQHGRLAAGAGACQGGRELGGVRHALAVAAEETKHDLLLKRIQVTIAILAGLATLILGAYNVKKTFFSKPEPVVVSAPAAPEKDPIRSALEETGASWIKKLGKTEQE